MQEPVPIPRSITRYRRCGWTISLLIHAALTAGLLAATFEPWWVAGQAARDARSIVVAMTAGQAADEAESEAEPEVRIIGDPADVSAAIVRDRLDAVVTESDAMPEADKLARLDVLSQRLTQVADEQSLRTLSGAMQSFLGTKPRAAQPPEERPSGDFDFDTAQFHDIRREPIEPAGFRYLAVLLDGEGRTMEVEVGEQEGKPIFETMQRIKANPLLEQVYRHIVMPLLDQMMAGVKQAGPRAQPK